MPDTRAEFAYLPVFSLRSACDLDLPLLLDGIVVGGGLATLALLTWRYRRRWATVATVTSLRQPMIGEDPHADRDPPPP